MLCDGARVGDENLAIFTDLINRTKNTEILEEILRISARHGSVEQCKELLTLAKFSKSALKKAKKEIRPIYKKAP